MSTCAFKEIYLKKVKLYDDFSRYEDSNNLILKFLLKNINLKNKVVLDIGAGTGKYARLLHGKAGLYYAMEPSAPMRRFMRKRFRNTINIKIFNGKAEKIPLKPDSVDVVISIWAFTTKEVDKKKGIKEIKRVLKPKGGIILVENCPTGELMDIWEKTNQHYIKTYTRNLIKRVKKLHPFKLYTLKSCFKFPTLKLTADCFGTIFGDRTRRFILKNKKTKIKHNIALFRGVNNK